MSRTGSVGEFSPAGTNVTVAGSPSYSNAIKTEAATDARVYAVVATVPGGATLDIAVMISPDGASYAVVASFSQISAAGNYVLALDRHQLGMYTKLRYTAAVGTCVLGATLEKKSGV